MTPPEWPLRNILWNAIVNPFAFPTFTSMDRLTAVIALPLWVVLTLLQLVIVSVALYLVLNVAVRCAYRLPLTESATRKLLRSRTTESFKDHPAEKTAFVQIARAQISIFLSVISETVGVFFVKAILFYKATIYAYYSTEWKGYLRYIASEEYLLRPETRPPVESIVSEKTLVFIRHGESVWNLAFNRPSDLLKPFRALYLWWWEFLLGCERDSVVIDSPLSSVGRIQAGAVASWLQKAEEATPVGLLSHKREILDTVLTALNGNTGRILVASSNLRRAVSTAIIAFHQRLFNKETPFENRRLFILSALQEATKNADGHALTVPDAHRSTSPVPVFERWPLIFDEFSVDVAEGYSTCLDRTFDYGSKSLGSTLQSRLAAFADWACSEVTEGAEMIVAVGHSLWIKCFFGLYLPRSFQCEVKESKIPNCAVVHCKLVKYRTRDGTYDFWIDPQSVQVVFAGAAPAAAKPA